MINELESLTLKIPDELQREFDKYFHLKLGGKDVVCPYYISDKLIAGNLRVMSGKGSAEEIELETNIWAKVKGVDLNCMSEDEIRKFMIRHKIGIDCSGLIVNVLDSYLQTKKKKHLWKYLNYLNNSFMSKFRRLLRPVENIGANTLTSDLNTKKISNLDEIKPGDLIRAKGPQKNAFHVAMVVEVEVKDGHVSRFKYANSHRYYNEGNGMRYGEVFINNLSSNELKDQQWTDIDNGRNYFYEDLMVEYEDNGIRRLNFAKEIEL